MYSPKNNKIFLKLIDEGIKRIKNKYKDVPYTTGRVLIQDVLKTEKIDDYTVFDDNKVFNKFCYNSEIPETAFAVHVGSTCLDSKDRVSWVPDWKLAFVRKECDIKKSLNMNERDTQFPYVIASIIIITLIILSFLIYKLLKSRF